MCLSSASLYLACYWNTMVSILTSVSDCKRFYFSGNLEKALPVPVHHSRNYHEFFDQSLRSLAFLYTSCTTWRLVWGQQVISCLNHANCFDLTLWIFSVIILFSRLQFEKMFFVLKKSSIFLIRHRRRPWLSGTFESQTSIQICVNSVPILRAFVRKEHQFWSKGCYTATCTQLLMYVSRVEASFKYDRN